MEVRAPAKLESEEYDDAARERARVDAWSDMRSGEVNDGGEREEREEPRNAFACNSEFACRLEAAYSAQRGVQLKGLVKSRNSRRGVAV